MYHNIMDSGDTCVFLNHESIVQLRKIENLILFSCPETYGV